MLDCIRAQADSGYQGISARKKPRGGKLTEDKKRENSRISQERILFENINAKSKVFRIMKYPYRNRRMHHCLRLNLICGIINFESRNQFPRKSSKSRRTAGRNRGYKEKKQCALSAARSAVYPTCGSTLRSNNLCEDRNVRKEPERMVCKISEVGKRHSGCMTFRRILMMITLVQMHCFLM